MHRARCVLPVAGVGPNPADQGGTGLGGGPFDESVGVLHPVPRGAVSEDLSGMTACRCGGWLCKLEPVRVVDFLSQLSMPTKARRSPPARWVVGSMALR